MHATLPAAKVMDGRFFLVYEGATAEDRETIEALGGLYFTPPELVRVEPKLLLAGRIEATPSAPLRAGPSNTARGRLAGAVYPTSWSSVPAGVSGTTGRVVHSTERFSPSTRSVETWLPESSGTYSLIRMVPAIAPSSFPEKSYHLR